MKQWNDDHPKAKLMNRKRAAILLAAKNAFLDTGYDKTSMESIAKSADVSIMTLYRHARSKDELFAAVTSSACEPTDSVELAKLEAIMALPLHEALYQTAIHMQQTLLRDDSIALIRLAVSEAVRFPRLSELAYEGFIQRLINVTTWILSQIEPASTLDKPERVALAEAFVDRLVGTNLIRVLLGLSGAPPAEVEARAVRAKDAVVERFS